MESGTTVKCQICGDPYVFYAYYAGDQSACPNCRAKAREKGPSYFPSDRPNQKTSGEGV